MVTRELTGPLPTLEIRLRSAFRRHCTCKTSPTGQLVATDVNSPLEALRPFAAMVACCRELFWPFVSSWSLGAIDTFRS